MKKKIKFLVMFMILSISLVLYGAEIKEKEQELEQNQAEMEQAQEELDINLQNQEEINIEIDELDLRIVEVEEQILIVEQQLIEQQDKINSTELLLEEAIKTRDQYYAETKERMVNMYKNNNKGYMEIIFSSDSLTQMLTRARYVEKIIEYDTNLLEQFEEHQILVQTTKYQLNIEYTQMQQLREEELEKRADLEAIMAEKIQRILELENEERQIEGIIDELQSQADALEAEIQELIRQEELRQQQATQSQSSSTSSTQYTGGQFIWPVPGWYYISSEYGPRTSPIFGTSEYHSGIDIPASYGSTVVAVADGRVITSGWINGYGYTVMIDHGGGLVTLYGHNSSLNVSYGDNVIKGQKIAGIGSTGYSTGNHLHFEVRLNGSHTSPWNYVSK
ncbi:MAG: hypothetical protein ATN35_08010 [Epulopiscium sp. Nele67-Bin004]|nr:MAG: hypothetical protein ATN35_08010 [Epulopiscium sp. Nele67-Bin004]